MNRIYLVAALALIGCGAGDNNGTDTDPTDSGIAESATGGKSAVAPKSLTTGGSASTGGQVPTGGSSAITRATGGSAPMATGGQSATGGAQATGGELATGGTSLAPVTAFACQDGTVRPKGELKCMCKTTAPLCNSGLTCISGICLTLATE
jgi:hypothetical protein